MNIHDINTSLLDVLGVDWRNLDVARVNVRIRYNRPPLVTIQREIIDGRKLKTSTERYTLQPVPAVATADVQASQGIDLDAMERDARARLQRHIDTKAKLHSLAVAFGFIEMRWAFFMSRIRHDHNKIMERVKTVMESS